MVKKVRRGSTISRYLKQDWSVLVIPVMSAMSSSQKQAVAAGVEAWRGFNTKRQTWEDWMKISQSLEVGEKICAAVAGKVGGGKFNRLYGAWLKAHGLDEIDSSIRSWLRTIRHHRPEIEAYRASLPDDRRHRLNHPKRMLMGYRAWKASQRQSNAGPV